jgi:hypothetical protein
LSAVTRRGVLKGGALASAAIAMPIGAATLRDAGLVVFDSAHPESRLFGARAGNLRGIDLAHEHQTLFAKVRTGLPRGKTIEGLTRWSDLTALRGELERQGWRMASEQPAGKRGDLFRWSMRWG